MFLHQVGIKHPQPTRPEGGKNHHRKHFQAGLGPVSRATPDRKLVAARAFLDGWGSADRRLEGPGQALSAAVASGNRQHCGQIAEMHQLSPSSQARTRIQGTKERFTENQMLRWWGEEKGASSKATPLLPRTFSERAAEPESPVWSQEERK